MRKVFAGLVMACFGLPVQAGGVALVLGNQAYDALPEAAESSQIMQTVSALEEMGFLVLAGEGLSAEEMRAQLAGSFEQIRREESERVVIVLSGHFASSESGVWLMGSDSSNAGLALADGQGLRLELVAEIAALASESAVLWLAPAAADPDLGPGLQAELPENLDLPEGVAALRGPAAQVVQGLRASLRPGTTLASIARANRALTGEGALPETSPFLPDGFTPGARADARAWVLAQETDTEAGYRAYLDAFPNGQNAQAARSELDRIRNAPDRIEAALFLTRDERRAIQRDLTVLGFDTRGIDGIFGPGTRGAISGWQARNTLAETGYLDRDQIFRLGAQAADRAAEIEAEERARREVEERADREFWALTGAAGDEPGLRSYLERYPQGIFAGLARERLDDIARAQQTEQRNRDLAAWRRARALDTVAGYESYLQDWPEGEFVENARARIDQRRPAPEPPVAEADPDPAPAPETPAVARARAAEAALGLPQPTRLLIERRLERLGLDPGPIDGVFDDQTRIAIRQAQTRFDLVPTGYVDQDFLTMMVSNLFREFFN
ncbi:peptidoglycan-binding domain-containing protein [Natronohydrobacter thiooxidans]|uniref:peptidoglycan-binding domain-containing protein n=1 Tax=Natronohydrobacter thiooxidans TaxID=87172 RepID=UPI0008FF110A|nr:peptidoglycan-binding protein [Natronohydrobacter thiooxidans]